VSSTTTEQQPAQKLSVRGALRLTGRGWLLLIVCVLLYLASLTSQSPLLLFLIGLLAVMLIVNLGWSLLACGALQVMPPEERRATPRQPFQKSWKFSNSSRWLSTAATIEVGQGITFDTPFLPPGAVVEDYPALLFPGRGVISLQAVTVKSAFPFGLIQFCKNLKAPGEFIIYPHTYATFPPPAARSNAQQGGKWRSNKTARSGSYFAGLRAYSPGDPLRQIHWKAAAKGAGLMSRTFEEELSGAIVLLLNPSGTPEKVESAISAAASLAIAALDAGDSVQLRVPQSERRQEIFLPGFSDAEELLCLLARINPAPALEQSMLGTFFRSALNDTRKASIVLVTPEIGPDQLAAAREASAAGRIVSVYTSTTIPHESVEFPIHRIATEEIVERGGN
jgi:uncharacterized protein (DUF58 family)